MKRLRTGALAAVLAVPAALTPALAPAAAHASAGPAHYTGTLPDGATWIADVPADWNGTLVLFSHGFGSLSPADRPSEAAGKALLDRGYALACSSYDPGGSLWALGSAVRDQIDTRGAVAKIIGRPRLTLALPRLPAGPARGAARPPVTARGHGVPGGPPGTPPRQDASVGSSSSRSSNSPSLTPAMNASHSASVK
ncbi:hypothetical protein [Actinomadura monticuli]|uniref:Alpha/beta hydrolase n=1 Tax=Actinomadura monticuli TaxID=3097367 RepID=A0ABV4QEE4_9ACTN